MTRLTITKKPSWKFYAVVFVLVGLVITGVFRMAYLFLAAQLSGSPWTHTGDLLGFSYSIYLPAIVGLGTVFLVAFIPLSVLLFKGWFVSVIEVAYVPRGASQEELCVFLQDMGVSKTLADDVVASRIADYFLKYQDITSLRIEITGLKTEAPQKDASIEFSEKGVAKLLIEV